MQDFAAELRAAREPRPDMSVEAGMGQRGSFESYLVSQATRQGFDLGHEVGEKVAGDRFRAQLEDVREGARLAGFDNGVSVLLLHTLLGLQEVVGELESRRAHKIMLARARAKLGELVANLESVATVLPPMHPEQLGMDMRSEVAG